MGNDLVQLSVPAFWNSDALTGAPAAILDLEVTLRMEAKHPPWQSTKMKGLSPQNCRATTTASLQILSTQERSEIVCCFWFSVACDGI